MELQPDTLFEALQNHRRRAVLRYLIDENDQADFRDLVDFVTASENDCSEDTINPEQKNRVRTALYQHHLEKLEDQGLVRYDKRDGQVTLTCPAETIQAYLDRNESKHQYWNGRVFGLLLVFLGLSSVLVPALREVVLVLIIGLGVFQLLMTSDLELPVDR